MLKSALIAVLSLCLILTGCTSNRYVTFKNLPAEEVPALKAGDTVRVTLKSGQVRRLKIATADHQTITGQDLDSKGTSTQFALDDIESMEVHKVSAAKTTGLVVGILVGIAAVLLGALLLCYEDGACEGD